MIPFLELKPTYLELREEMDAAYHRVMNSGWYLIGAETEAFETEFAAYIGTRHCVTVGNGLDALRILLEAHGVGPGDEVIVPAHTFIATWLAVSQCGAVPVGVDVRGDTANMNASLLDGYRFDNLSMLYNMSQRASIRRAA
jgi:dTDP-4-amino-4,6-dideoxygalactose transaminase